MNIKLMTSALALSAVLAYGGVAFADPVIDNSEIDESEVEFEDSFNDNSDNEWESEIEVEDSFNDNSDHSTEVEDSYNDNSDHSTEVEDSYNDNREWDSEVEVEDSFNDNREWDSEIEVEDSFNDEREYEDSFNDEREWEYEDSFNSDSSTEIEDSYNDNSDHSTNTYDIRVSLNYQDLDASVSGIGIDMHEQGKGSQNGNMTSGGIQNQGGAFAGFAGIQTVTNNTGIASTNQAATAVSANANISFGGGHH